MIAAAKAAQCHEFISKLRDGYHTVVGSKGIHLSGGERQRIAIARAIIKDSPIIVLDEATAFSDPENEYLIQKAFEKLMQGKTVIIIAHRLSTICNADKIIVMEKGHLVEEGKHDELGGRRRTLCTDVESLYRSDWLENQRKGGVTMSRLQKALFYQTRVTQI